MNTSVQHSLKRRTPAPRTVVRMFLMAGISYSVLPSVSAHAQTSATAPTKHAAVHKNAAKKKAHTTNAPTAAAPAVAPVKTTAAATHTNSKAVQEAEASAEAESLKVAETVTVTGTRLSQTRLTNVMAGSSLSADQIKKRGYTDIGIALMRENPAFGVGDNTPIGSQGSFGAGQSFTSLFNLGSQRTLTLIDGMRMVGGSTASLYGAGSGSQVDISAIPTSLLKGVDTKFGGAGAAYGADAVAGVVNYQLDDHFTGVDFNAQGNWSQKLDAPGEKITFKAGHDFDHGKGGIVFDVEYRNQGGMLDNDRINLTGRNATTYVRAPYSSTNSPYIYNFDRGARNIIATVTGVPELTGGKVPISYGKVVDGIAAPGGQPLMFSNNGQSLVPINWNYATKSATTVVGGNATALQDYGQLYTPTNKLNLTLLGHYDITDHIHATWQGWYARGTASSEVGQGTWSTPQFNEPLTMENYHNDGAVNGAYQLSTNNPYLSSAARSTIMNALAAKGLPTDTFYMSRLNQDLDGGMFQTTMQMFRFQGGLNGDFDAVGRHFDWKVRGEYSRYMNDTWQPSIVAQNLINSLNSTTDASGNIVCSPGYTSAPIKTRSSNCAAFNPFGTGQATPAAVNYITADAHQKNTNAQRDLQAEISSTVMRLPAGDVKWDIGYEHRREGYRFNPGAFSRGWEQSDGSYLQYGNSTALPPTGGAYHTHEVFGELDVPLVSPSMHVPGVYSLSGTANGRYINNSMTGGYWTYMFGGAWWPTQDFGLSGNYARSIRNPSVTELFAPQSTDYELGIDPCSTAGIGAGPNPALRAANCAKAGITQPFESNFNNFTIEGQSGGNNKLKNEVSTSYTGTLELRPHFIRGLDFRGSFIDIKINNAITSLSPENLMDACYDSASYGPSNAYCNSFQRGADGQLQSFTAGYYNIANYETQALQANLTYDTPLSRFGLSQSAGSVGLSGIYVHYLKSQQTYLGSTYLLSGTTSAPNDNFTLNANYMRGPFSLQWQALWYGPSNYAVQVPDNYYAANKRPSWAYFNLTLGYDITKNFSANFMVNNITNALPKYPGTVSLNRYYDAIIGRSFQMNLGVHF
ncbi:TonB-dependent receptor [Gluconobacter cerevisiae]|uniref:TonB-dependent receptor n=2 Tax=Gluconobacter cerevisiae TaxID=1379734 RepID=A0ABR9YB10_9PROT|nr:TonB-dependent receptor [Gluconobacter cerevisiae]